PIRRHSPPAPRSQAGPGCPAGSPAARGPADRAERDTTTWAAPALRRRAPRSRTSAPPAGPSPAGAAPPIDAPPPPVRPARPPPSGPGTARRPAASVGSRRGGRERGSGSGGASPWLSATAPNPLKTPLSSADACPPARVLDPLSAAGSPPRAARRGGGVLRHDAPAAERARIFHPPR